MYTVHATKKLAERLKTPFEMPAAASTRLGNWYATMLDWRPHVALFVNETTFLPVFVSLTPARTALARFGPQLGAVLRAHGFVAESVIAGEVAEMGEVAVSKTASRQVLGVMNEYAFFADAAIDHGFDPDDLVGLSVRVASVLISPLGTKKGDYGEAADALRAMLG